MPRLILLALIFLALIKIYIHLSRQTPERRRRLITRGVIGLAILAIIILMLMGRLPRVSALIAFLLPVINYLGRLLIRFSPLLASWLQRRAASSSRASAHDDPGEGARSRRASGRAQGSKMTPREAREILGVSERANQQEIISAHRRLMQSVHPDQGGSDYLASQLNQARDTLLG